MSSPAQGGPSVPQDKDKEKKSVGGRMLTRMKTIMKKAEKRMSISGSSKAGPSSAAVKTSEPTPAPADTKKPEDAYPNAKRIPRMQIHDERARKLGERFGLEIKPSEWHSTEGDALRVEKSIRMRVHRICHECKTSFGPAKECPKCKHARCKECQRYPPKRTEAEKVASRERRAAILKERAENPPIIADWDLTPKKIELRRPRPGGADLIYKKPRQRVRRNCCQCEKLFGRGSKTCESCSHARCTDCKRDPAKKTYYPIGYPGDEFGANSVPWHECHECKTKYPPGSGDGTSCSKCSHEKCADCPRLKPQKIEPEPDPEVVKSLEARLGKLRVG